MSWSEISLWSNGLKPHPDPHIALLFCTLCCDKTRLPISSLVYLNKIIDYAIIFLSCWQCKYDLDARKLWVLSLWFVNNKGADQPAHPLHLISTFVIRLPESIIFKLAIGEISIFYSYSGWFGYDLVKNPKDRFSRVKVHIIVSKR